MLACALAEDEDEEEEVEDVSGISGIVGIFAFAVRVFDACADVYLIIGRCVHRILVVWVFVQTFLSYFVEFLTSFCIRRIKNGSSLLDLCVKLITRGRKKNKNHFFIFDLRNLEHASSDILNFFNFNQVTKPGSEYFFNSL